jgi:adenine/guanine phosphoribosyltransferase-like PRPP-binding protein
VLLVDDTFTTGAHVHGPAIVLHGAGAEVVAAVALGRVVDTRDSRYPEKLEFWRRQKRQGFSFGRCCLEA